MPSFSSLLAAIRYQKAARRLEFFLAQSNAACATNRADGSSSACRDINDRVETKD